MSEGFSIIKVDDLSKPATVLIEKIAGAVGGYFKPYQIRRVAKAEAEADKIKAEAQIKITDLHRRAVNRFISEEAKRQENIENITEKAIPLLNESSNPQNMEDDWITNFFDKCRIISDEEMQQLWAKILAGEANIPGTYSKYTVNLMGSLYKEDAMLFTKLCGYIWQIYGEPFPLIFDDKESIYNEQSINFGKLTHLDDIGLINFESLAGFKRLKLPQKITIQYYGIFLNIEFQNPENNELGVGNVLLTYTGKQLSLVCVSQQIEGFYDFVIEKWSKEKFILSSPLNKK